MHAVRQRVFNVKCDIQAISLIIQLSHLLLQGDATVTYDDPPTASAAIEWFNGKLLKQFCH